MHEFGLASLRCRFGVEVEVWVLGTNMAHVLQVVSKLKSGARKTLLDLGIKEDDIVEFEVPKP